MLIMQIIQIMQIMQMMKVMKIMQILQINRQHSTVNSSQQSTVNSQPSTVNSPQSTFNSQQLTVVNSHQSRRQIKVDIICRKLFKDGPSSTFTAFRNPCGDKSSVQGFQFYVLKFCCFQSASSKVSSLFRVVCVIQHDAASVPWFFVN